MRGLPLATLALVVVAAGPAPAQTGILAFSGETLHQSPPDPLIAFGAGRAVSLVPYLGALVQHGAEDSEVVLLLLESGEVRTAESDVGDAVWYEESGVGRDVSKLVSEPGGVLLFETPAGSQDPGPGAPGVTVWRDAHALPRRELPSAAGAGTVREPRGGCGAALPAAPTPRFSGEGVGPASGMTRPSCILAA